MDRMLVAAGLAACMLCAPARATDDFSAADRAFVAKVGMGGLFEVKAGQAAADKGAAPDIRDLGAMEAHDHALVNQRLRTLVSGAGIDVPDGLDADYGKQLDALRALSGPAFDSAYLGDMERIHVKDAAAFAAETKGGTDPDLREFATETHRIVLRHLGAIRAVGPGGG